MYEEREPHGGQPQLLIIFCPSSSLQSTRIQLRKRQDTSLTMNNSISLRIAGAYFATVLLILVSSFFPAHRLWGVNQYAYFDSWVLLCFVITSIVIFIIVIRLIPVIDERQEPAGSRVSFVLIAAGLTIVFAFCFYLFRAKTHFLGDGYLLLSQLESQSKIIRPWNRGVYLILNSVYSFLGANGRGDSLLSLQLISWMSGLCFLGTALITSVRLFETISHRLIFTLGLMTAGYALLFFGYVENYPLLVLAVGTFCLLGLLSSQSQCSPAWLLIPLLAGMWFHPYAVAFVPAVMYLFLRRTSLMQRMGKLPPRWLWGLTIISVILCVLSAYLLSLGSRFLQFALLPLIENRFTVDGYSLISTAHILDVANLLILLVPPLPIMILLGCMHSHRAHFSDHGSVFLLIGSLGALLILLLFDPKLGMPRDWDMFAFAGVPLATLLYWSLLHDPPPDRFSAKVAVSCVVVSLMVLVPRVITQSSPELGVSLADSYHLLDVKKNRVGRTLVVTYFDELGNKAEVERRKEINEKLAPYEEMHKQATDLMNSGSMQEALEMYRRVVEIDPSYSASWSNMGSCFRALGQLDSALSYLEIADGINPYNSMVYNNLGAIYDARGDASKSEQYWRDAIVLDSTNLVACRNLLTVFSRQRNQDEYSKLARHAAYLTGTTLGDIKKYADFLLFTGSIPAAARQYRRALQLGLDSSIVLELQRKFPALKVIPEAVP